MFLILIKMWQYATSFLFKFKWEINFKVNLMPLIQFNNIKRKSVERVFLHFTIFNYEKKNGFIWKNWLKKVFLGRCSDSDGWNCLRRNFEGVGEGKSFIVLTFRCFQCSKSNFLSFLHETSFIALQKEWIITRKPVCLQQRSRTRLEKNSQLKKNWNFSCCLN